MSKPQQRMAQTMSHFRGRSNQQHLVMQTQLCRDRTATSKYSAYTTSKKRLSEIHTDLTELENKFSKFHSNLNQMIKGVDHEEHDAHRKAELVIDLADLDKQHPEIDIDFENIFNVQEFQTKDSCKLEPEPKSFVLSKGCRPSSNLEEEPDVKQLSRYGKKVTQKQHEKNRIGHQQSRKSGQMQSKSRPHKKQSVNKIYAMRNFPKEYFDKVELLFELMSRKKQMFSQNRNRKTFNTEREAYTSNGKLKNRRMRQNETRICTEEKEHLEASDRKHSKTTLKYRKSANTPAIVQENRFVPVTRRLFSKRPRESQQKENITHQRSNNLNAHCRKSGQPQVEAVFRQKTSNVKDKCFSSKTQQYKKASPRSQFYTDLQKEVKVKNLRYINRNMETKTAEEKSGRATFMNEGRAIKNQHSTSTDNEFSFHQINHGNGNGQSLQKKRVNRKFVKRENEDQENLYETSKNPFRKSNVSGTESQTLKYERKSQIPIHVSKEQRTEPEKVFQQKHDSHQLQYNKNFKGKNIINGNLSITGLTGVQKQKPKKSWEEVKQENRRCKEKQEMKGKAQQRSIEMKKLNRLDSRNLSNKKNISKQKYKIVANDQQLFYENKKAVVVSHNRNSRITLSRKSEENSGALSANTEGSDVKYQSVSRNVNEVVKNPLCDAKNYPAKIGSKKHRNQLSEVGCNKESKTETKTSDRENKNILKSKIQTRLNSFKNINEEFDEDQSNFQKNQQSQQIHEDKADFGQSREQLKDDAVLKEDEGLQLNQESDFKQCREKDNKEQLGVEVNEDVKRGANLLEEQQNDERQNAMDLEQKVEIQMETQDLEDLLPQQQSNKSNITDSISGTVLSESNKILKECSKEAIITTEISLEAQVLQNQDLEHSSQQINELQTNTKVSQIDFQAQSNHVQEKQNFVVNEQQEKLVSQTKQLNQNTEPLKIKQKSIQQDSSKCKKQQGSQFLEADNEISEMALEEQLLSRTEQNPHLQISRVQTEQSQQLSESQLTKNTVQMQEKIQKVNHNDSELYDQQRYETTEAIFEIENMKKTKKWIHDESEEENQNQEMDNDSKANLTAQSVEEDQLQEQDNRDSSENPFTCCVQNHYDNSERGEEGQKQLQGSDDADDEISQQMSLVIRELGNELIERFNQKLLDRESSHRQICAQNDTQQVIGPSLQNMSGEKIVGQQIQQVIEDKIQDVKKYTEKGIQISVSDWDQLEERKAKAQQQGANDKDLDLEQNMVEKKSQKTQCWQQRSSLKNAVKVDQMSDPVMFSEDGSDQKRIASRKQHKRNEESSDDLQFSEVREEMRRIFQRVEASIVVQENKITEGEVCSSGDGSSKQTVQQSVRHCALVSSQRQILNNVFPQEAKQQSVNSQVQQLIKEDSSSRLMGNPGLQNVQISCQENAQQKENFEVNEYEYGEQQLSSQKSMHNSQKQSESHKSQFCSSLNKSHSETVSLSSQQKRQLSSERQISEQIERIHRGQIRRLDDQREAFDQPQKPQRQSPVDKDKDKDKDKEYAIETQQILKQCIDEMLQSIASRIVAIESVSQLAEEQSIEPSHCRIKHSAEQQDCHNTANARVSSSSIKRTNHGNCSEKDCLLLENQQAEDFQSKFHTKDEIQKAAEEQQDPLYWESSWNIHLQGSSNRQIIAQKSPFELVDHKDASNKDGSKKENSVQDRNANIFEEFDGQNQVGKSFQEQKMSVMKPQVDSDLDRVRSGESSFQFLNSMGSPSHSESHLKPQFQDSQIQEQQSGVGLVPFRRKQKHKLTIQEQYHRLLEMQGNEDDNGSGSGLLILNKSTQPRFCRTDSIDLTKDKKLEEIKQKVIIEQKSQSESNMSSMYHMSSTQSFKIKQINSTFLIKDEVKMSSGVGNSHTEQIAEEDLALEETQVRHKIADEMLQSQKPKSLESILQSGIDISVNREPVGDEFQENAQLIQYTLGQQNQLLLSQQKDISQKDENFEQQGASVQTELDNRENLRSYSKTEINDDKDAVSRKGLPDLINHETSAGRKLFNNIRICESVNQTVLGKKNEQSSKISNYQKVSLHLIKPESFDEGSDRFLFGEGEYSYSETGQPFVNTIEYFPQERSEETSQCSFQRRHQVLDTARFRQFQRNQCLENVPPQTYSEGLASIKKFEVERDGRSKIGSILNIESNVVAFQVQKSKNEISSKNQQKDALECKNCANKQQEQQKTQDSHCCNCSQMRGFPFVNTMPFMNPFYHNFFDPSHFSTQKGPFNYDLSCNKEQSKKSSKNQEQEDFDEKIPNRSRIDQTENSCDMDSSLNLMDSFNRKAEIVEYIKAYQNKPIRINPKITNKKWTQEIRLALRLLKAIDSSQRILSRVFEKQGRQRVIWLFPNQSKRHLPESSFQPFAITLNKANKITDSLPEMIKLALQNIVSSEDYRFEESNMVKEFIQMITGSAVFNIKSTSFQKLKNLHKHENIVGYTFSRKTNELFEIVGSEEVQTNKKELQKEKKQSPNENTQIVIVRKVSVKHREVDGIHPKTQKQRGKQHSTLNFTWQQFMKQFKHSLIGQFSLNYQIRAIHLINPKTRDKKLNFTFCLELTSAMGRQKQHCLINTNLFGNHSPSKDTFKGTTEQKQSQQKNTKGRILVYEQKQEEALKKFKYLGSGDLTFISMKLRAGKYLVVLEFSRKVLSQMEEGKVLVNYSGDQARLSDCRWGNQSPQGLQDEVSEFIKV